MRAVRSARRVLGGLMPRPTTRPRLQSLDGAALGRAASEAALAHVMRLAVRLLPGIRVGVVTELGTPEERLGETDLAWSVRDLVAYAQTGNLGAWDGTDDATDTLAEVAVTVGLPADPAALVLAADLDDPVHLGLAAAAVRIRLAADQRLSARELGILAGIDATAVRALVTLRGERHGYYATPAAARRWLAAREVPGVSGVRPVLS
jgi:hypothetical protein